MSVSQGRLHAWRVRWLGDRDPIAEQLRDIARQGSSMARLAHTCAFLLILLFSAGSLVALGGDALATIQRQWAATGALDIPAAISISVSTLMVLAMDVGMVYAASMLRLLATRQGTWRDKAIHQGVIVVVAVLEASTYAYMSWLYEHPTTTAGWALIIARALAAPFLSVYLSMARPLPVTSRDILYQVELAAGHGVIRDVVEVASDAGAPLAEKMSLYGAAAHMTPHDRTRLDLMIAAVTSRAPRTTSGSTHGKAIEAPIKPPTGPGTPATATRQPTDAAEGVAEQGRLRVMPAPSQERKRAAALGRANSRSRRGVRTPSTRTATVEAKVRAVWQPAMSVSDLERAAKVSRSAAGKWRKVLLAEAAQQVAL